MALSTQTTAFAGGRLQRIPELDGLRGIAVLLVVASHASIPVLRFGGAVGVTLFFVLSGYLITTIVLRDRQELGRVDLRGFYVRRALRLVPALVVALVGGGMLAVAFGSSPHQVALAAGASALYVNNFSVLLDLPMAPFANLWSLAVEEQFYVVWPLSIWAVGRHRPRLLLGIAALASVASLLVRFAGGITTRGGYEVASALPHTNAWAPLLGCILAIALGEGWRPSIRRQHARFALAYVVAVASVLGLAGGLREQADASAYVLRLVVGPLAAAGAAVLVLYAVIHRDDWRLLRHPVLLFFGSISYGLYLWHGILDHVMGRVWGSSGPAGMVVGSAAAVIAVGVAVLSRRYVEAPFLERKAALARRPAQT